MSQVFRLRPEELALFFKKEHLDASENKGEIRESLRILQKVGGYKGLLSLISTDGEVNYIYILSLIIIIDWYYWRRYGSD